MIACPKGDGDNINIASVEVGSKHSHKGNGLGGHTNNALRGFTAISTLGVSNLVWKKSKGGSRSKTKLQ